MGHNDRPIAGRYFCKHQSNADYKEVQVINCTDIDAEVELSGTL